MELENQSKVLGKVKELMEVQGYSQPKLAELAGISFQSLNNYFVGRSQLTDRAAEKILSVFGLSVYEVLGEDLPILNKFVRGYLEYNGEIKRINSFKDAENFVKKYREEVIELPKKAKAIISLNAKNARKAEKAPDLYDYSCLKDPKTGAWELSKVKEWLNHQEEYDATRQNCWSFKVADDVRDGKSLALGNQISIPYDAFGFHFYTNENAYLAGQFGLNDEFYIKIQKEILEEPNGYKAKKSVRNRYEDYIRKDWMEIRADWMLFCLWNKCNSSNEFREMLLAIPTTAILIEQGTTENTGGFWGCHNTELNEARDVIERYVRATTTKKVNEAVIVETNKINCIGTFKGVNCMGKCLNLCKMALETGTEPPIDYSLLKAKQMFFLGKQVQF